MKQINLKFGICEYLYKICTIFDFNIYKTIKYHTEIIIEDALKECNDS